MPRDAHRSAAARRRAAIRSPPRLHGKQTRIGHLSHGVLTMTGELLVPCDFGCLVLAAWGSTMLSAHWVAPLVQPDITDTTPHAALMAAVLAAFMFYNKRFGSTAVRGATRPLLHTHALRFALFAGIVVLLNPSSPIGHPAAAIRLALWLALGALSTSLTRILLARYVQHLQLSGVFTEVIAVVGAGPVADRLVQHLLERPATVELLGIFDDNPPGASSGGLRPYGTVAQLIELGKTRHIDWIVLTLPATADRRLYSLVQRLKALAVPIGLCSQHVGSAWLDQPIDFVGQCVPITLLAARQTKHRDDEEFMPRWVLTLVSLPFIAAKGVKSETGRSDDRAKRHREPDDLLR